MKASEAPPSACSLGQSDQGGAGSDLGNDKARLVLEGKSQQLPSAPRSSQTVLCISAGEGWRFCTALNFKQSFL